MAMAGNKSKDGELDDDCKDATEKALVLYDAKNVVVKQMDTEMFIVVSDHFLVQFGSNSKVQLKDQSCKNRCKNCHSSSDEENLPDDMLNIEEVTADSHAHINLFKRQTNCSETIDSVMPIIPKRGCMNNRQYDSIITKLRDLNSTGDFVGHEQMVENLMAKTTDPDMKASLQIERAMALYFQNNIKHAMVVLQFVVKHEQQLKNPRILVGRALNLLTAIRKRQKKLGKAMQCATRAVTCLEGCDSPEDKAELNQSYAALLTAIPAAKNPDVKARQTTKKNAYKYYQIAAQYGTENVRILLYGHLKMAALLLESGSKSEINILNAKKHLDFVENKGGDDMGLGTRIKLLLLRSDQHLCEGKVGMALKKAEEANELIIRYGFQLESDSAKKRIDSLSAIQKKENVEWLISEDCSSSSTNSDHLTDSESALSE